MEIRDAIEEKEHCYTDQGEEIVCPVCGTAWLHEVEGDFTFENCDHLRFTLHSECGDDFEFFGEWDAEGFIRLLEVLARRIRMTECIFSISWARLGILMLIKEYYTYGMMTRYIIPGCCGDITKFVVSNDQVSL